MFHNIKNFTRGVALASALGGAAGAQATTNTSTPPAATSSAKAQEPAGDLLTKGLGGAGDLLKKLLRIKDNAPVVETPAKPAPKAEPAAEKTPAEPVVVNPVSASELKLETTQDFELAKVDLLKLIATYQECVKGFRRGLPRLVSDDERTQAWNSVSHLAGIELVKMTLTKDIIFKAMDKKTDEVVAYINSNSPINSDAVQAVTSFASDFKAGITKEYEGLLKFLGNNTAFNGGIMGAYITRFIDNTDQRNVIFRTLKMDPNTFGSVEDQFVRDLLAQAAAQEQSRRAANGVVPGQTVIAQPAGAETEESTTLKTLRTVAIYAVPVAGIWAALRYLK
jgi:hypothetical protein